MNVLYLHKKPKWGQELKFSLRSVEKYVTHDRVYVVGYRPQWLTNVIHVPCKRRSNKFLDANHKVKTGLAFIPKDEPVLLMHDDMFFIEPYEPTVYHNGRLKDRMKGTAGDRKELFENTLNLLGDDAVNYCLHYPMPFYNKGWKYDNVSYMSVLGSKSKFPKQETDDCKFHNEAITQKKLQGLPCFSTASENDRLLHLFEQLYPNKSKYER